MSRPTQDYPARSTLTEAGFDLQGNMYWEWKIVKHAARTRRIVEYPGGVYHSDVNVPRTWPLYSVTQLSSLSLTPHCSTVGTMAPSDPCRSAHHRRTGS